MFPGGLLLAREQVSDLAKQRLIIKEFLKVLRMLPRCQLHRTVGGREGKG